MNHKQLKSRIHGPVFPVLIPFLENGKIDYRGVESYARFLVDSGARVLMLTAGTSRLNLISTEELQRCNEVLVYAAGDRALAIVSGPMLGGTEQQLEVLNHADRLRFVAMFRLGSLGTSTYSSTPSKCIA